jgi:sialate O-acetylesterase
MFQSTLARSAALAVLSLSLLASPAFATVRLPSVISDHMVLQRGASVPIWGWAAPHEKLTIKFGDQVNSAQADGAGHWKVALDLHAASRATTTLAVRGETNAIDISDVLVGEVWLASGQSNMEKPLGDKKGQKPTLNAEAEIAAASHPDIRIFKVAKRKFTGPQDDVNGKWEVCTPASIQETGFSAVAYFFGRKLKQELNAPVGLIDSTWGGTRIEPWTPAPQAQAGAEFAGTETREYKLSTI